MGAHLSQKLARAGKHQIHPFIQFSNAHSIILELLSKKSLQSQRVPRTVQLPALSNSVLFLLRKVVLNTPVSQHTWRGFCAVCHDLVWNGILNFLKVFSGENSFIIYEKINFKELELNYYINSNY